MKRILPLSLLIGFLMTSASAGPDLDGNQLSDIWEVFYNAPGLVAGHDDDGDGFSNAEEEKAGTNPLQSSSRPSLAFTPIGTGQVSVDWNGEAGILYELWFREDFSSGIWQLATEEIGTGDPLSWNLATGALDRAFFRLGVSDPDTDADTLSDWEERLLGFNPENQQTQRLWNISDDQQVAALWDDPSTVTVGVVDDRSREETRRLVSRGRVRDAWSSIELAWRCSL